jgi:hypothetical protein
MSTVTLEKRQTVIVPITTYEEFVMPSKKERDEFITSLEESRAQIARGECSRYTEEELFQELVGVYNKAKNIKLSKA